MSDNAGINVNNASDVDRKRSKENRKPAGTKGPKKEKSGVKSPADSNRSTSRVWFSPSEYKLRQSLPSHLPKRPTDIYLSGLNDYKELSELHERAKKLLREGETVWIHSIGSNIAKGITFVNKLVKDCEGLEFESYTHSWELTDNWGPRSEDTGPKYNSGLHIRCKLAH